jgi:hypothetical protein
VRSGWPSSTKDPRYWFITSGGVALGVDGGERHLDEVAVVAELLLGLLDVVEGGGAHIGAVGVAEGHEEQVPGLGGEREGGLGPVGRDLGEGEVAHLERVVAGDALDLGAFASTVEVASSPSSLPQPSEAERAHDRQGEQGDGPVGALLVRGGGQAVMP